MASSTWKCQRVEGGVKCGYDNPKRAKKCQRCSKPRPPKKKQAHLSGLDVSYEEYIVLNGGEEKCGICGFRPGPKRRLDRDHDHKTGAPRGLLCPTCNRKLWPGVTISWVKAELAYLERAAPSVILK